MLIKTNNTKLNIFLIKRMRLTSWLVALIGKIILAAMVIFLIINIFEVMNIKWDQPNVNDLKQIVIKHYNNFNISIFVLLVSLIFIFSVRLVFKFFYFARDNILYRFNQKKKIYIFRNVYNVYSLIAIIATFVAIIIIYSVMYTNIQILYDSIERILGNGNDTNLEVEKVFEDFVLNLKNAFLTNNSNAVALYVAIGIIIINIIFMVIYIIVSLVSKFAVIDNKKELINKVSNLDNKPINKIETSSNLSKQKVREDRMNYNNSIDGSVAVDTTNEKDNYFIDDNKDILTSEQAHQNMEKNHSNLLWQDELETIQTGEPKHIVSKNQSESNDNVWGAVFQPPEDEK